VEDARISIVVITRDRRDLVVANVERLVALPERPRVVVVDNGSRDGTVEALRGRGVEVVTLGHNRGSAGRNVGVDRVGSPYVAFADDDSWWADGALARAAAWFDAHPRLGLVAARMLVGPEGRLDSVSAEMAASPLEAGDGGGPPVLGFLACGAVVRRRAFLEAGGFHRRFGVGGEEALLALDLAVRGWELRYCQDVVAHHHPAVSNRDRARRRAQEVRNALWVTWLRRRGAGLATGTLAAVRGAGDAAAARRGLVEAARGSGWVVRERRAVPMTLERQRRLLD
jgi:GT2 family glycosyltransferase